MARIRGNGREHQLTFGANEVGYPILYRGHASALWAPETTLDRYTPGGVWSVAEYYWHIARIQGELKTYTGQTWRDIDVDTLKRDFAEYDPFSLQMTAGKIPHFDYLVYLRHFGFPSPFLDWSRSPYVAAHFALKNAVQGSDPAVLVLAEAPQGMKMRSSDRPTIFRTGHGSAGHRRHFLQQSTYTICVRYENRRGWLFAPHYDVFLDRLEREHSDDTQQDIVWKLILSADLRDEVLDRLDRHNLNSYSLFGSEESLMETLAFRLRRRAR